MPHTVYVKSYPPPEVSRREAYRYMGERGEPSAELSEEFETVLAEMMPDFTYNVCYAEFDIEVCGESVKFPFETVHSANLARHLAGCTKAVLFAATVGIACDRRVAKYGMTSPVKALAAQGIGAERVEALCDAFCADVKNEYGSGTKSRFSPGYGDLDIAFQKTVFAVLDCPRKIGLTLNNSMLMSPSKSVTAIIGLEI